MGRRIQLLEAEIRHEETLVARGSGLRIRAGDTDATPEQLPPATPLPSPTSGQPPEGVEDWGVYLHRYPAGEWVGLESRTWVHGHGVGLAESLLWDEQGPNGRSLQSLVVGRRP